MAEGETSFFARGSIVEVVIKEDSSFGKGIEVNL